MILKFLKEQEKFNNRSVQHRKDNFSTLQRKYAALEA